MTRIFKHLIRIIKHKYWVAHYCFQLGLYWQGIVHDWSKFSYTEFSRSIKYWDDTISPLANEKNIHGYSETFLHHRGRNPHHYEYWVHSLDEGGVPAKMPRKYALELVCDYLAATRARLYKKELHRHACKTGFPTDVNLGFCCHDFSMRGMAGMEAAIISGMAHMTSFVGSETIPAIAALEEYYGANSDEELIAATVPATEHSVMCAGGEEDELGTFKRLINDLYPSGFVSIVSDTWDFWNVIENFLPKLKKDIMARDGRVVIRPDSGDPVDIICGLRTNPHFHTRMKEGKYYCCYAPFNDDAEYVEVSEGQYYGAYYMLGKIFGWNTTLKDYRYPSTKIGLLYGDSITLERQKQIYIRLENAHMAACNLVLGVGSFSYQYASRDSLGFAIKATACVINGELKEIFKHPKTDDGTKNSLKGLIAVYQDVNGIYYAKDQVEEEEEYGGCLETVFEDGVLKKEHTLKEIRQRINEGLYGKF